VADDDLTVRVAALETRVEELTDQVRRSKQDAAAARVLAGGADHDVAEFGVKVDANRKAINALGVQTTARFDRLEQRMDSLEQQMNSGFTEIRGKLDATATGQQQIVNLLNTLINQQQGD
jgi:predicted  nucleic acid-binding Zn-ribbon protein